MGATPKPVYFPTPADFRRWLAEHHAAASELWVGFHKRGTGVASLTWPESVDEALCFGWIDGVRRSVDERRYAIRFTPRRPGSTWSAVNLGRVEALAAAGRMRPAGLAAHERRDEAKSRRYSYERQTAELGADLERRFRDSPGAWEHYQRQPPGYRRTTAWWVTSAKREATRLARLEKLVAASAAGRSIAQLERKRS